MATTYTKQVLENGNRNYIALFNITSDGSALSAVNILNPTSTGDMGVTIAGNTLYPGTHVKIWRLAYNLPANFSARLIWEASAAQDAWDMYGFGKENFMAQGGLPPASNGTVITGATGKIDLAIDAFTVPTGATLVYGSFTVWLKKDIKQ